MSLSLSWLWQFNFFLWEIGFCQKWARVLAGWEGVFGRKKRKARAELWKTFLIHTNPGHELFQRYHVFIHPLPFMHESKLDTDGLILYKSMTTLGLLQVGCAMAAIDKNFNCLVWAATFWVTHNVMNVKHWTRKMQCYKLQSCFPLLQLFSSQNFLMAYLCCQCKTNSLCVEWGKVYLQHGFLFLFWIIFLN